MSLHFIGIREFPVLHRQLSSPAGKSFDLSDSTLDLARDSKDVLIQRLNDLARRLLDHNELADDDVESLHVEAGRMEDTLRAVEDKKRASMSPDCRSRTSTPSTPRMPHDDDMLWRPFSPTRSISMRFPESPTPAIRPTLERSVELTNVTQELKKRDMSSKKALLLAKDADALLSRLADTLAELKTRKEETDHIHDLLITRAEKAAQRILYLEHQLQELSQDYSTNLSTLSFLRIQLRALEVQGQQYIPFNADAELSESIRNWKMEWADVDMRTKKTRKRLGEVLAGSAEAEGSKGAS